MIDTTFLKKIVVLYVEDDIQIRNNMSKLFQKLFKKVILAVNGQDGQDKFRLCKENNIDIDIVISDINMPDKSGIEMLKDIRLLEPEVPVILTTAHSDARFFLDAIKLNVFHYAIKPIQVKELTLAVQDATLKHFKNKIITAKQFENERYLDIINQVAIVSKTDLSGNITYANDIFCEVSGYSKDELIGVNQRIVRHSDMPTVLFDSLWDTLRSGKVWRGKIKNKTKDGGFYFVNSHIFPIFDQIGETIVEYMAVRFLITDDELEKRNFHKKVIQNIKETKVNASDLKSKISELELQLSLSDDIKIVFETLKAEKRKSANLLNQVNHYEKLIETKVQEAEEFKENSKKEIDKLLELNKDKDQKNQELLNNIQIDKNEIREQQDVINTLNDSIKKKMERIQELEDVVKFQENKINLLKVKN